MVIDRRPGWLTAVWSVLAVLLAGAAVGPAVWLLVSAFEGPGGGTFKNFTDAWTQGKLLWPLLNSVVVTVVRAALNVVIAAMAAYPLARMSFRGRDTVFTLLLATMMVPDQVVLVPMFRTVAQLGLYDTLLAVIVPFSVTAFGIYLCRQAFAAIPAELEEAARIDGAGSFLVWRHVMLPLAAPTLATLGLFSVIGAWSELLWPLVVLQTRERQTLPVAVSGLMGQFSTNIHVAYAASVIVLVPIILAFVAAQRFLKGDLFGGAVKG